MHPTVREEIMKAQVADKHRHGAQARLARAARRSSAQAPARQPGTTKPIHSVLYRLRAAVSARTTRRRAMLNSHQLADELNPDRLNGADHQSPASQLQSQRHLEAASHALQAIRQAINEIDAIIESALNRLTETARAAEDAENRPAETDDAEHTSAVPAPDASLI
jgi:hypothetical protein